MKEDKKTKHSIIMGCCDEHHMPLSPVRERILARMHKLGERGNVVMTRLNDVDLEKIDALVEVEVFNSRSEELHSSFGKALWHETISLKK